VEKFKAHSDCYCQPVGQRFFKGFRDESCDHTCEKGRKRAGKLGEPAQEKTVQSASNPVMIPTMGPPIKPATKGAVSRMLDIAPTTGIPRVVP